MLKIKDFSGIYGLLNRINNKIYVGSSIHVLQRWKEHKTFLNKNIHPNVHLQGAWNIDSDKFDFIILEKRIFINAKDKNEKEQYWMDFYKSYNPEKGYNISPKAGNLEVSDESKKKISLSKIGKPRPTLVGEAVRLRLLKDKEEGKPGRHFESWKKYTSVEEILALYSELHSAEKCATKLHMSEATISKILRANHAQYPWTKEISHKKGQIARNKGKKGPPSPRKGEKIRRKSLICNYCKKEFEVFLSQKNKFCSRECTKLYQALVCKRGSNDQFQPISYTS